MNEGAKMLVNALREDAERACANGWETPITLGDHLNEAAGLIESLSDQLEQTENKLSELLYYVTGGRFSKTDYSTDDMRRFVDDYTQSECNECDQLEYVNNERDGLNIMLAQAQAMLETRTKERDAAVEDLRKVCRAVSVCFCCKSRDAEYVSNDCMDCVNSCNWQWRGVEVKDDDSKRKP